MLQLVLNKQLQTELTTSWIGRYYNIFSLNDQKSLTMLVVNIFQH